MGEHNFQGEKNVEILGRAHFTSSRFLFVWAENINIKDRTNRQLKFLKLSISEMVSNAIFSSDLTKRLLFGRGKLSWGKYICLRGGGGRNLAGVTSYFSFVHFVTQDNKINNNNNKNLSLPQF